MSMSGQMSITVPDVSIRTLWQQRSKHLRHSTSFITEPVNVGKLLWREFLVVY